MVDRIAVRHFFGEFLHGKMETWVNWETEGFFFFLSDSLDVLQLRDWKRGVLNREGGLEICEETYSSVQWRRTKQILNRILKLAF